MKWDADKHRELVAREGDTRRRMQEIAMRINDRANTDAPATDADTRAYTQDMALHTVASREHDAARRELERMEELNPLSPAAQREPSAAMRFLRDGATNLSGEERQAFVLPEAPGRGGSVPTGFNCHPSDFTGIALPRTAQNAEYFIEHVSRPDPFAAVTRSDQSPGGEDWHSPRTYPMLTDRLADFGGALRLVSMLTTSDGVTIGFPQLDDTAQEGEYLTNQGAAATQGDLQNVRDIDLETQIISSKMVDISLALITDTVFDVESVVRRRCLRRMARGTCKAIVIGAGANKTPRGITIDAATGKTAAGQAAITDDELSDLMSSVDNGYIDGEQDPAGLPSAGGMTGVGWLAHQETVGEFRKLAGTDGHPIWLPSIREGDPMRLYGKPVVIDNAMPKVAAGLNSVAFGNFGYYIYREVDFRILARFFDSGVAASYKVRFLGFQRNGGRFVGGFSAGDTCEAVKVLKQAA